MEKYRIAVDAMGGDNAPHEIILGAALALKKDINIEIILLGNDQAKDGLELVDCDRDRLHFIHTPEVVLMEDHPGVVIKKRHSSLVQGLLMLKKNEADAFVSAGNTGAVLYGAQAYVGSIDEKRRARSPLAMFIPTDKGMSLLLDCGANVDPRPADLLRFAKLGSIYYENMMGVSFSRVALVNIGQEETKGNALTLEAYALFKECGDINFIGNIESRDIPSGIADIVVCDAFVGNVILKLYEGLAKSMMGMIKEALTSSTKTKLGATLVKGAIKDKFKVLSSSEYGGAPLLGLSGLVVKTHGNSTAIEITNSILQATEYIKSGIGQKMKETLREDKIQ